MNSPAFALPDSLTFVQTLVTQPGTVWKPSQSYAFLLGQQDHHFAVSWKTGGAVWWTQVGGEEGSENFWQPRWTQRTKWGGWPAFTAGLVEVEAGGGRGVEVEGEGVLSLRSACKASVLVRMLSCYNASTRDLIRTVLFVYCLCTVYDAFMMRLRCCFRVNYVGVLW